MNQCTMKKQMSSNKHVLCLTTKLLMFKRGKKKKETRIHEFFRVTRAPVPSETATAALYGRFHDTLLIGIPMRRNQSAAAPVAWHKKGKYAIFCDFKKVHLNSHFLSFLLKFSSRRLSVFFIFFILQGRKENVQSGVSCVGSSQQSGATAPTTFHLH